MADSKQERRRLDRILRDDYADDLDELTLDGVRTRRDECLAEREYLSYLRRLLHGRIEILRAEREARASGEEAPLVDRLATIFGSDTPSGPSRGEALRLGLPEEDMALARRRVERLISDAAISDPTSLGERELDEAIEALDRDERAVSDMRQVVMRAHDLFQEEFKRRYKERLSS